MLLFRPEETKECIQSYSQITSNGSKLSNNERNEGNNDIITNSPTIIHGNMIDSKMKSLIKKGEVDCVYLIQITHIFRSSVLKVGDSIIVLFRNGAEGSDSVFEPRLHSFYPEMFSEPFPDRKIHCEIFLTEYLNDINFEKLGWGHKKVYELFPSKYGYATVYFKDRANPELDYDVYALFNLKFKTRQDWYNYLKKYDNIKVPEGY